MRASFVLKGEVLGMRRVVTEESPWTGARFARMVPTVLSGVPERTRTSDLQVRNLTLYPLSYGHPRE
jgi:hypothetical protein